MMDISVNKDWTEEEVWAAEEEYILNGGETFGIYSPLHRWSALHRLDEYQLRYEKGDKFALMLAIGTCAEFGFVMPKWTADSFLNAICRVANYEEKNWDDVFGKPIPKGANLNALRKKLSLEGRVYLKMREIILKNPGRAIDANLFDEVGDEFGLGKTLAEEYYRSMVKKGCEPLTEVRKNIDEPRYKILKKQIKE